MGRLTADDFEAIRRAKARYFRGVDTCDGELVRSILARDCVLDYRGCMTDPASGEDFLSGMNVVLTGRDNWSAAGLSAIGIASVHQGHDFDIEPTPPASARSILSFTDRLYLPAGGPYRVLVGHGHYHEAYVVEDGAWRIATLRITRLKVEGLT